MVELAVVVEALDQMADRDWYSRVISHCLRAHLTSQLLRTQSSRCSSQRKSI